MESPSLTWTQQQRTRQSTLRLSTGAGYVLNLDIWQSTNNVQAVPEGIYGYISNQTDQADNAYNGNTYKGLRLVSDDYSFYYAVYCNNEREFYDLKVPSHISLTEKHLLTDLQADPRQTMNLAAQPAKHQDYKIANRPLQQVFQRANALMMVLKSCTEDSCRDPWAQLHPAGAVQNIVDALDKSFDKFYANQPRVSFTECSLGYHIWAEGPQKFNVYGKKPNHVGARDSDDKGLSSHTVSFSDM